MIAALFMAESADVFVVEVSYRPANAKPYSYGGSLHKGQGRAACDGKAPHCQPGTSDGSSTIHERPALAIGWWYQLIFILLYGMSITTYLKWGGRVSCVISNPGIVTFAGTGSGESIIAPAANWGAFGRRHAGGRHRPFFQRRQAEGYASISSAVQPPITIAL
jgi:hypothetical protein